MKIGLFVGVNWDAGKICMNRTPQLLEEFMDEKGIKEPQDVMGPFYDPVLAEQFRNRVANFFRRWDKSGNKEAIPAATLQGLVKVGAIK